MLTVAWWPRLFRGCQQEFLHRTSLESQKLSLMGEVSYLKLKLSDMEGKQGYGAEKQHKAEVGRNQNQSKWFGAEKSRHENLEQLKTWKA